MKYYIVYEKKEMIGYFVSIKEMLISFAINIVYRTKEILNTFFKEIINKIGLNMYCFLYGKNIRAIKWLIKNGMEIELEFMYKNINITKLKIKLCQ